jgi:hypothetical protein
MQDYDQETSASGKHVLYGLALDVSEYWAKKKATSRVL